MEREQAKEAIKAGVSCLDYLEKSERGNYCCPFCGSGHGENRTGAVKYYSETNDICCFGRCGQKRYDVIDLHRQATGTDYNEALEQLAQRIGITIDPYTVPASSGSKAPEIRAAADKPADQIIEPADYTAYYKACIKRLKDPAAVRYLQGRGISPATAAAYWIGYDPAADPAGAPGATDEEYKPHPCPRIIIPTSKGHYIARSIDPNTPKAFVKMNPAKDKGAAAPTMFNTLVLFSEDVKEVFVTEGAFDALSVMEAGAAAISLNSTSNADKLIKRLEKTRTKATLILCLDNDEAGKKATETIREGLQRLNISFICADICCGHKDPNEALTADRAAFIKAVEQAKQQTAAKPDNTSLYIDSLMTAEIERFKSDKQTGFAELDRNAGGLYSGLYVLAAISSIGKTSFALQLADQIAAAGHDVLFFALEQSRLEMVSKSLARITAQADPMNAVSSLDIRKGYAPAQAKAAAAAYKEKVADRLSIIEGNFDCNLSFIGDYIRQYVRRNGTRPVVFVDYLQILQPAEDNGRRQTTRETVDSTVTELKRLSRELDLTVFIISSVNRSNYLTPIDFESLKESGGIEYTADVVWGLQLQCLNEDIFSQKEKIKEKRARIKEAKAENPRKIELVNIKNRYGKASYTVNFCYYPERELFEEIDEEEAYYLRKKSKGSR